MTKEKKFILIFGPDRTKGETEASVDQSMYFPTRIQVHGKSVTFFVPASFFAGSDGTQTSLRGREGFSSPSGGFASKVSVVGGRSYSSLSYPRKRLSINGWGRRRCHHRHGHEASRDTQHGLRNRRVWMRESALDAVPVTQKCLQMKCCPE